MLIHTPKLKFYFLLIIFIIFSCAQSSNAKPSSRKQNITVLTWWGYLNHPEIVREAENKCNVNITFDEYYSNDEFLRRWLGQKDYYDIIIFSDTIYSIVKSKLISLKNSTLWQQSSYYNPIIKDHYIKKKYPHNVVYFFHAMTGFLWNPKSINLDENDSILSIFEKAKDKYVVLLDDPVEAKKLIDASIIENKASANSIDTISIPEFKSIIQNTKVYITNNYSQIYQKNDFAFSFSWSGEAIVDLMEANKKYEFLIHPKLSYLSSDLISQTSSKKGSLCVTKFLTSKKTISTLQNSGYYFSPYTDYSQVKNPVFKLLYQNFISALPFLVWTDSINEVDFQKLNMTWQLIKISLNNHLEGK